MYKIKTIPFLCFYSVQYTIYILQDKKYFCLSMRTSRPTTRTMFASWQVFTHDAHPAFSCLRFLCRSNPTDPLIACERRNGIPHYFDFWRSEKHLLEISRNGMHNASGKCTLSHMLSFKNKIDAKDRNPVT